MGDGLVGILELSKDLIPGGELVAGGAKVLVGLGSGVAGNAAQTSENEAAAHPELYLLNALAAAATNGKKPVCLVDADSDELNREISHARELLALLPKHTHPDRQEVEDDF